MKFRYQVKVVEIIKIHVPLRKGLSCHGVLCVGVCVWGDDAMIALAKVDDNTIYDTPQGH